MTTPSRVVLTNGTLYPRTADVWKALELRGEDRCRRSASFWKKSKGQLGHIVRNRLRCPVDMIHALQGVWPWKVSHQQNCHINSSLPAIRKGSSTRRGDMMNRPNSYTQAVNVSPKSIVDRSVVDLISGPYAVKTQLMMVDLCSNKDWAMRSTKFYLFLLWSPRTCLSITCWNRVLLRSQCHL